MRTEGDRLAEARLAVVGGKGLFVREIEEALLRKEIDLAVHSLKDLPAELPERAHAGRLSAARGRRATCSWPVARRHAGHAAGRRGGGHLEPAAARASSCRGGPTSTSSRSAATSTRACASSTPAASTRSCWRPRASTGWA